MKYYVLVCLLVLVLDVTAQQKFLAPGDSAPVPKPYRWLKGTPVEAYAKGQVYVLEFGATWCGPCKKMIPVLTALQEKYNGQVTVVSFFVSEANTVKDLRSTPSYLPVVERYVAKQRASMGYRVALDDPTGNLFKTFVTGTHHAGIPTVVVVDGNGKIGWIGSNPAALQKAVATVVAGEVPVRPAKEAGEQDTVKVLFESRISTPVTSKPKYYPYHIESYLWLPKDPELSWLLKRIGTVTAPNRKLIELFDMAWGDTLWNQVYVRHLPDHEYSDTVKFPYLKHSYGKYYHHPIYEGDHPEAMTKRYDYTLRFSSDRSAGTLREQMRSDLAANFPYDVTVEVREMPVWLFVMDSKEKFNAATTTGGPFTLTPNEDNSFNLINAGVRDLIWIAGSRYGFTDYDVRRLPLEDQAAFIDQTQVTSTFRFRMHPEFTFQEFNQMVEGLGLKIIKGTKAMKVVVIRDRTK